MNNSADKTDAKNEHMSFGSRTYSKRVSLSLEIFESQKDMVNPKKQIYQELLFERSEFYRSPEKIIFRSHRFHG